MGLGTVFHTPKCQHLLPSPALSRHPFFCFTQKTGAFGRHLPFASARGSCLTGAVAVLQSPAPPTSRPPAKDIPPAPQHSLSQIILTIFQTRWSCSRQYVVSLNNFKCDPLLYTAFLLYTAAGCTSVGRECSGGVLDSGVGRVSWYQLHLETETWLT